MKETPDQDMPEGWQDELFSLPASPEYALKAILAADKLPPSEHSKALENPEPPTS